MTSRGVSVAAGALLGCSLLAAGCRDHGRQTNDDYVGEMRHLPLGRLVFGFSAQISSRASRAAAHAAAGRAAMPRERIANSVRWTRCTRLKDIAALHNELVAAAMRVNDALLAEAQLLRPNERTPAETYAAYIFKFEALQRHQEIASNAGDRAYYAIKRKGYDIGPSGIEDLAHR